MENNESIQMFDIKIVCRRRRLFFFGGFIFCYFFIHLPMFFFFQNCCFSSPSEISWELFISTFWLWVVKVISEKSPTNLKHSPRDEPSKKKNILVLRIKFSTAANSKPTNLVWFLVCWPRVMRSGWKINENLCHLNIFTIIDAFMTTANTTTDGFNVARA